MTGRKTSVRAQQTRATAGARVTQRTRCVFSRVLVALTAAASLAAAAGVSAQTISSAANQTFGVGNASTTMSAITIRDALIPTITAANDIRIRIPAGFNMTWDPTVTTATITGGASGKVSTTVSYANGNLDLVLNVTSNFATIDRIVVSGLKFTNFTATSPASNLGLITGGSGGAVVATDNRTKTIVAPTISSAANQTFVVGAASTTMSAITITDAATPTITAAGDIRIRIPAGFNMTWNTGVPTATFSGSAAGKVTTTVSYENSGQVLRLNVLTDFVAGDQIVVSGLQFNNFTAPSAANSLQLVISGSFGGATVTTDGQTKTIVAPTLTGAANQVFTVGDPATAMTASTVTDNATSPTITAANDIRIRIPSGFNMTWNTAITTATITGSAAGKVSTTVSYENSGQILVLNVTSNFAVGDQITVSGLQYNNFTAVSAANNLQLVVSGSAGGGTAATSDKTSQIYAPLSISSAANQMFNVGMGAHTISAITITGDASSQINTANGLRIRIPSGLNMTWNTALTTATIGGAAAAKVSTTVSYEDAGKTLVLAVMTNFAPGDQITVAALQYNNFTAVSAANNLQLATGGAGAATAATDNKTISIIAAYGISSAANQVFGVGGAATAMSVITVTDSATTPSIDAGNNIRIRIPTGFNMTWNTALTTATLSGSAAGKVTTLVTYENSGQVLFLNVLANFVAGDQLVISGLQFNNFTASSATNNLQLVVSGTPGGATVGTDDKTITIYLRGVSVSPASTTASRLPSNGTNYTVDFTVQNTGGGTDNFDLLTARNPGTTLTTVSITGTGVTQGALADSARLTGLASGASTAVTVTYSIGNVAAGSIDTLKFTARSTSDASKSATGKLVVTVIRPNVTTSRVVSPTGAQPPGTLITHTITITNTGTTSASTVIASDSVSSNLQFKVGSVVTNLPAGITVALEYSNDGGTSWTYTPVSAACSAPTGFDGCVNRIRWRLLSSLSSTPPDNTGNVQFASRIR